MQLFSRQILLGTGLCKAGYKGGFPWVMGPGCCRVQFWLMLYVFLIAREKDKKRDKHPGGFIPRADMPSWLCHARIFLAVWCNCRLFKESVLEFYVHLTCLWLLFWLEAIRIIPVVPTSQGGLWIHRA
jgi:hypothetical protein